MSKRKTKRKERARRTALRRDFTLDDATAGLRRTVREYPVIRLDEPGGEVGYAMDPWQTDNCLSAALATATQIPIEQVPELKLDKRHARGEDPDEVTRSTWARIADWAEKQGLNPLYHEHVPVDLPRWIGVVPEFFDDNPYGDHCLVMSYDRLVFDPASSMVAPPGMKVKQFHPNQIVYGLSFERRGSDG